MLKKVAVAALAALFLAGPALAEPAIFSWTGYGLNVPGSGKCPTYKMTIDVTVVGKATRRELLRLLPSLRAGKHLTHPAVRTLKAREVHLDGNDWPVYADGEPMGGDAAFEVVRHADEERVPVVARHDVNEIGVAHWRRSMRSFDSATLRSG